MQDKIKFKIEESKTLVKFITINKVSKFPLISIGNVRIEKNILRSLKSKVPVKP